METIKKITLQEADKEAGRMHLANVKVRRKDKEVTVTQFEINTRDFLTEKELYDRADFYYHNAEEKVKIKAQPLVFDEGLVSVDWVKDKLKELEIPARTMRLQLGLKASFFSSIMHEKITFSKQMKALFFYYIVAMHTGQYWRAEHKKMTENYISLLREYKGI